MNDAPTLGLPRWPAADQALVDVLDLFPRYILRGTLPDPLLQQLIGLSESVLALLSPVLMLRQSWRGNCVSSANCDLTNLACRSSATTTCCRHVIAGSAM